MDEATEAMNRLECKVMELTEKLQAARDKACEAGKSSRQIVLVLYAVMRGLGRDRLSLDPSLLAGAPDELRLTMSSLGDGKITISMEVPGKG